jgi:hypothetical protein
MNAASQPLAPDRESRPLRTTVPEGATHSVPPPDPGRRNPWHGLIHWVQVNTFAPEWLPEWLRHPLIGYLAAALIQGMAVGVILVVYSLVPDFDYYAILALVGVLFVALGWGVGPGLFATLVSTLLLNYVAGTPRFSWEIDNLADGCGLALYLVVGVTVSLLAGQNERDGSWAGAGSLHLPDDRGAPSRPGRGRQLSWTGSYLLVFPPVAITQG